MPQTDPIIDLRPRDAYIDAHLDGSTHLPWPDLQSRLNELPARPASLTLVGELGTVNAAQQFLMQKGYHATPYSHLTPLELFQKYPGQVKKGQDSRVLWRPNPLISEFMQLLEQNQTLSGLGSRDHPALKTVDVGCGGGRDAIFLAQHGFDVTGIEHKATVLQRAQQLANRLNIHVNWQCCDLMQPDCFTQHAWEVIVVMRFLNRELFRSIQQNLVPGGWLIFQTFTQGCEKFGSPKNPNFILQPNELSEVFSDFTIFIDRIDTIPDGRPVASFIAQKKVISHARNDSYAAL